MTVITNEGENTLANAFSKYLKKTERLDALVGYFYFSGFQLVYKNLQDKQIRILVGMDIDENILKKISSINISDLDGHLTHPKSRARSSQHDQYIREFATIFNNTDEFDNEEALKSFEIFLAKIKDGSLQIKKTVQANHSKNYIFHFKKEHKNNGDTPGVVISGSSNLSFSGMQGQRERNRILIEKHYYQKDFKDFEEEWNNADNILITDISIADDFIEKIKQKTWPYQSPSPLMLYYKVLHEYFSIEEVGGVKMPSEITDGQFTDLRYQRDAIEMGIDRIRRFGGVIVADVVGLGKSIIASTIAHNLGMTAIIIAPPHLAAQWEDYRAQFRFDGFVYTTGKIDEALKRHGKSMEKLLIILDEAHKHRNEDTENYRLLHQLCAGNDVMALSATPFNNDPKDVYALIKLFTTPGQSTIKTVENLSMAFHELFTRYKKARKNLKSPSKNATEEKTSQEMQAIAAELRRMIEPLVIRRSRIDLQEIEDYKKDLESQDIAFSEMEPPKTLEYELGTLSEVYMATLNAISPDNDSQNADGFEGARYKPASYIRPNSPFLEELFNKDEEDEEGKKSIKNSAQRLIQGQANIAKLMRRLLVRRFESSQQAFKSSLASMIQSAEQMSDWFHNQKEVPIYKKGDLPDPQDLNEMTPEKLSKLMEKLEAKGLIRIPAAELTPGFIEALEKDIALLKNIQKKWQHQPDPKQDYFLQSLQGMLQENPNRKIIVFTEFADTAEAVFAAIKNNTDISSFKYTAADANQKNKKYIQENFDAGINAKEQKNEVDVLVATDAISEGFNLHRAGIIINYDIPYNPTRVIQRVGRINRINKKVFDKLFIYNFFPSITGEAEIKAKTIAVFKKNLIDALLGDDTQIFTEDETLQNFFAKEYAKEKEKAECRSWDAKYRNDWHKIRGNAEIMQQVKSMPHRVRIGRASTSDGVIVLAKRNKSFVFAYGKTQEDVSIISPKQALPLFNGDFEKASAPLETTANFDAVYQVAKQHIFKDNTMAPTNTNKNRQEAMGKVQLLGSAHPLATEYAKDLENIIKNLDALPMLTLKKIAQVHVQKAPAKAFEQMQQLVPKKYIEKILTTASNAQEDGKIVLLSAQLMAS